MTGDQFNTFQRFASQGDTAGMAALVAQGLDLASLTLSGHTALDELIVYLQDEPQALSLAMVKETVRLGADASQVDDDGFGPLVPAMLHMNTELLRFLLDAGADANVLCDINSGPTAIYDWGWNDYQVRVWDVNKVPAQPSEEEDCSEEGRIAFFDRVAVESSRRRPDHLALLRERGAKTLQELREAGAV